MQFGNWLYCDNNKFTLLFERKSMASAEPVHAYPVREVIGWGSHFGGTKPQRSETAALLWRRQSAPFWQNELEFPVPTDVSLFG
jgi:hypothetical protein